MARSWPILARSRLTLGLSWPILVQLTPILVYLGPLWPYLGPSWTILGLANLGHILAHAGPILVYLGEVLGRVGKFSRFLGGPMTPNLKNAAVRPRLEKSWAHLGATLEHFLWPSGVVAKHRHKIYQSCDHHCIICWHRFLNQLWVYF